MSANCVMCEKEIDIEKNNYVTGMSLGERWCMECARDEIKENICWTCGHYAFGCFVTGSINQAMGAEDTCGKWCPEGTKGTVTDFSEMLADESNEEHLNDSKIINW